MSNQPGPLTGRIALVTNVAHFVGLPAAVEMAAQGATAVCHDKSFTDADARTALSKTIPGSTSSPSRNRPISPPRSPPATAG